MNILYIHGFGSKFDPESPKIISLGKLGTVYGVNLDYTDPIVVNYNKCRIEMSRNNIDLVVGTSMGGYMAALVSGFTPFAAINPATNPREQLRKYLGTGIDHTGREYTMTEKVLEEMPDFRVSGDGIIFLDEGDEVIDSAITKSIMSRYYPVIMFEGGNHRFEHMDEAIGYMNSLHGVMNV